MPIIKPNSFALYTITLIAASLMTCQIIISNYKNEIYPIAQDTITIPLFMTTGALATLILLALIELSLYKKTESQTSANLFTNVIMLLCTSLSLSILAGSISYWFIPHHRTISALYSVTLSIYLINQTLIYKKRFRPKKSY